MNRLWLEPNPPDTELLFAAERELVPEPDDFREQAFERARASLPRNPSVRLAWHAPRAQRVKVGLIAAAAVMLFALCAVAFFAGYRIRPSSSEAKAARPALVPFVVRPPGSAAPAPTPPASIPEATPPTPNPPATVPGAAPSTPSPRKAKPRRSVIDVESYAMERRILEPAQQAVAQREYGAALPAIAEHQYRFPAGQLAEEREALRVKALLGLGRTTEAQRAGAAFRERFPHSAILGRIDEMVGTPR